MAESCGGAGASCSASATIASSSRVGEARADLGERLMLGLEAPDEAQPGQVAGRVARARPRLAGGRQQALGEVVADRPRGHPGQVGQLGDRVGGFVRHGAILTVGRAAVKTLRDCSRAPVVHECELGVAFDGAWAGLAGEGDRLVGGQAGIDQQARDGGSRASEATEAGDDDGLAVLDRRAACRPGAARRPPDRAGCPCRGSGGGRVRCLRAARVASMFETPT